MVRPHSTFTESQFHPKPISSLLLLSGVYSVFKLIRAAEIFMPRFFHTMASYFGRCSLADESRLHKDAPKRWNNEYSKIYIYIFFLEGGKSKLKQEVVMVLEATGDF